MAVLTTASGSVSGQSDDAAETADGASPTTLEGQTVSKRPFLFGDDSILSWVASLFRRNGHLDSSGDASRRE